MSRSLSEAIRRQVAERAGNRCEYCLVPEYFLATVFHIDHIRSIKHRGTSTLNNLAYACPHCNQYKGTDVGAYIGDDTDQIVRLFNPRKDVWQEHFETSNGLILPITDIGNVTVSLLEMNQPDRLIFRQELSSSGFYP